VTDGDYRPIDCSLHDKLEDAAVRGAVAHLVVREEGGGTRAIQDRIVDLFARDGAEYMRTGDGTETRLDRLESVNGEAVSLPRSGRGPSQGRDNA
jgi:Rho-binding antiterminator